MRIIEANKTGVLNIGFAGEKDRTQVWFDISDVEAEFPGGFVILHAKRAGENTRYDISVETENGIAIWTVGNYDAAIRGDGECQLVYSAGGKIAKQKIWKTHVDRSIEGANASIPPTWQDIDAEMLEAAAAVHGEILAAEDTLNGYVEAASREADRAEQAASTAGYMYVEIIDGRLIYSRTDNVDVDFELEDGRLVMEVS